MICWTFQKLEIDARKGPGMSRRELRYLLLTMVARMTSAGTSGHGNAAAALRRFMVSVSLEPIKNTQWNVSLQVEFVEKAV
jgi:hypothetical protein